MTSKKISKKKQKKLLLIHRILTLIKKGKYASEIARQLNKSKQFINYWLNQCLEQNLIEKKIRSSFQEYELTEQGKDFLIESKNFSLPMKNTPKKNIRTHNLNIKFKILKDNPLAKFDKETAINNWVKKYITTSFPLSLTIEKTTKSIILYVHEFHTEQRNFLNDFYEQVLKATLYTYQFLQKKGILIDIMDPVITHQHIANESPEHNEAVDKGVFEMNFNRDAKSIFPTQMTAKAWIDRSKGNVDIETNDMIYEEKLLAMPETVHELYSKTLPILNAYGHQISLHLKAIKQIQENLTKQTELFENQTNLFKNIEKSFNKEKEDIPNLDLRKLGFNPDTGEFDEILQKTVEEMREIV